MLCEMQGMDKAAKVYVAGHTGLVGSAIMRALERGGWRNVVAHTREELDLTDTAAVEAFFATEKPEYVFVAAAKVGGVLANNTYPAEFIHHNLQIATNVIHSAYEVQVTKLLYLGSTCIYPREAGQPMKEEYFMTGPLEPTNVAYATAKIAGITMCQAYNRQYGTHFISAMPTNLYGPNDNFDLKSSHVLPALIRKFTEAKHQGDATVTLWGTGTPRREFMYVDDMAEACLFLMEHYDDSEIVNIGVGEDISVADLATLIGKITGFTGSIVYDSSKPDGMPRKWVDVSKLRALGFTHKTSLEDGIKQTYEWYLAHNPVKEEVEAAQRVV